MEEKKTAKYNTLQVLAKLFLVLGCLLWPIIDLIAMELIHTNSFALAVTMEIFLFVPLAWCIPLIVYYFIKTKKNEGVSLAFKIFSFILVSRIAGILMICDNKN